MQPCMKTNFQVYKQSIELIVEINSAILFQKLNS